MTRSAPSSLGIQVAAPSGTNDVQISLSDSDVTIGEVFSALGLPEQGTAVDGRIPANSTTRAVEMLTSGSQLTAPGVAALRPELGTPVPSLVEVAVVAGLDAGAVTQLPEGRYRLGQQPGRPESGWYLAIDHPKLAAQKALPWHEHGPTVEAVSMGPAVVALGKPVDSEAGYAGYVHRPPRPMPPHTVAPIEVIAPPKPISKPAPLSWATLLAPIPIALLMAFFFRPLFAIFAAMGPVIALARWSEGRRKYKRDTKNRDEEIAQMRADIRAELRKQSEAEARLRWLTNPHVAELWRRARSNSVRLWERRPGALGYMSATVGVAPDQVDAITDDGKTSDEVHSDLTAPVPVRAVPHVVDLAEHIGVGVHGERHHAVAVARSLVMQLATLHGPADLKIGLLCTAQVSAEWDWLKWLPHVDDKVVAQTAASIVKELTPNAAQKPTISFAKDREVAQVQLFVVDDTDADVAAIHRAAVDAQIDARFIAIAPHPTLLPAACSSLVGVQSGSAEISTPELIGQRRTVCPTGLSRETAAAWARAVAPLSDPEVTEFSAGGDDAISLLQLVNFTSTDELAERWDARRPDAAPVAAVGVGDAGPFSINMTEDGPHALVAGTTGSGKSEFLRTLVVALATECPPEQLNFVLVDFKGGGAFDICDRLPHIAGLITDLDEAMVVRAINSLRAELHRREHLFRELGVSSYDEAACLASEPLARLLIVVDEFAALATDYADLMTSIVDLAARGRSLGMHLILATQRPSGVVDQKIRANTNLRVALRVQDAFDSQDVIGVGDAAAIDRKAPGRAIFSIGGDTPVTIQTAYSGADDVRSKRCSVKAHSLFAHDAVDPSSLVGDSRRLEVDTTEPRAEIDVLIEAIEAVSASRNYEPRSLWPEPLPEALDWIDLGTRVLSAPADAADAGVPLGLVDLPDRQAQLPWRWDPDSGALVLYGSSADCAGKALSSLGAGLAATGGPDQMHLYLIDGDAGNISALTGLAHTGAYVTVNERDRLDRTIAFFEQQLAARRTAGNSDADPRLVLLIDNLAAVLGAYDDMAAGSIADRLGALARDGAPQRVHMVITARTVRDLSHRLAQQIPNRLVLALADPNGYLTLGLKAREVAPLPDMRAMDLATKRVLQLVEPPDVASLARTHDVDAAKMPAPIRTFPTELLRSELDPATVSEGVLTVPVGIEANHLRNANLVLQPGEHALIVSPPGGGRSTALQTILEQVSISDVDLKLFRLAPNGSPLHGAGLPGTLLEPTVEAIEALRDQEALLVVDDADRLDETLAPALEALTSGAASTVRVVAASTPDFARGMRSWTAKIRAGGTGMVLGGTPHDGDVLKAKLTPLAGLGVINGRGHLVVRGRVQPAQFAAIVPAPNATS